MKGIKELPNDSFKVSDNGMIPSPWTMTGIIRAVIGIGKVSVTHHRILVTITPRVLTASGLMPLGAGTAIDPNRIASPATT